MPVTDYQDVLLAAEEAKRRAEALRADTEQPGLTNTGKWVVAPHWSQRLAPVVRNVMGHAKERESRRLTTEGNQLMEQDARDWMSQRPQGTTATEQILSSEDMGGFGPLEETVTKPPSQQENLTWAQRGVKNPLTKTLASKYAEDALINEPERVETRKFRASEAKATREAREAEKEAERARLVAKEKEDRAERERRDKADKEWRTFVETGRRADQAALRAYERARLQEIKEENLRRDKDRDAQREQDKTIAELKAKTKGAGKHKEYNAANSAETLEVLAQAEPFIDEGTSSGLGAKVDQGLGFFGLSTDAGDAAAKLRLLEGNLILKMPRFEGPQSNLDQKLYRQMAGSLGDPTIPVSQKRAAYDELLRLHTRLANGEDVNGWNATAGGGGGGGPVAPASPAKPPPPPVGTVKGNFRFKGGDPSLPTSWEKIQ